MSKAISALILLAFLVGMPIGIAHADSQQCSENSTISDVMDDSKAETKDKSPFKKISDQCHCILHCLAIKTSATHTTYDLKHPVLKRVLISNSDTLLLSQTSSRLDRPPRA